MIGLCSVLRVSYSLRLNSRENLFVVDLTSDGLYTYFINNHRTAHHESIVFGLRELTSIEFERFCSNNSTPTSPPTSDNAFNFSANYEIRLYTSGCYYLDLNNNWQSDGLLVSFTI